VGARDVPGAEVAAGDRLGGDRDGVEGEGQQRPDPEGDLVRGDGRVALPGGDGRGDDQRGLQRQRARDQRRPGEGRRPYPGQVGREAHPGPLRAPPDDREVGGGRAGLRDRGTPRGTGDAPVQDQHEGGVQHDVHEVGDHRGAVGVGQRFRIAAPAGIRISYAVLLPAEATSFAGDLARCLRQRPTRAD
jgi:hypothetical protein